VRYDVTWPETSLPVHAPHVAFRILLVAPEGGPRSEITLTMPPPQTIPREVRDRSLFVVPVAASPSPTLALARTYQLLTARAFDRLYDEIWSLLFSGDPRVPLRDPDGEALR
jgi:hypothetical protein